MRKFRWLALTLVALIISAGVSFSQEEEEKKEEKKGSYYTISTFKINFSEIDLFLEKMEKFKPTVTDNEFVLSQKVMTHVWGEDWAVVTITEYADFASIAKAQKRMGELYKEMIPDDEKRKEETKKYQKLIQGHYDSIVREVASLTK